MKLVVNTKIRILKDLDFKKDFWRHLDDRYHSVDSKKIVDTNSNWSEELQSVSRTKEIILKAL